MRCYTENWEYYLAQAYEKFEEAHEDENLYNKIDKLSIGLQSLCEHLNVVQKEYLNSIKNTSSKE